jgi:hypothetical protein
MVVRLKEMVHLPSTSIDPSGEDCCLGADRLVAHGSAIELGGALAFDRDRRPELSEEPRRQCIPNDRWARYRWGPVALDVTGRPSPARVLIVEDDPQLVEVLVSCL